MTFLETLEMTHCLSYCVVAITFTAWLPSPLLRGCPHLDRVADAASVNRPSRTMSCLCRQHRLNHILSHPTGPPPHTFPTRSVPQAVYYALLSRPGPLLGLLDYYLLGRLGSRSWNSDDFVLVGKLGGGSYGNAFSGVQLQVSPHSAAGCKSRVGVLLLSPWRNP